MEHYKTDSRSEKLEKYCCFAKEHDSIEITEWKSGEGFTVYIERSNGDKMFSLTHGELAALTVLANART